MATGGDSPSVLLRRTSRSISTVLAKTLLEWLLIIMLFINAIFAYLITVFAHHYELQPPCQLCSRIDHLLVRKKWKYHRDLICRRHKSEISSLVLCHTHSNLADAHVMCDNCLFSVAATNKSTAETQRLLVAKLEENNLDQEREPLLEAHTSITRCSCCNEPRVPRGHGQALMQTISVGTNEHQHSLKKSSDLPDPLSHVAYSELEINSADDLEINLLVDTKASTSVSETKPCQDQLPEPRIVVLSDDLASAELINQLPAAVDQGLEKINCQSAGLHGTTSPVSDLISIDDISPASKESPVEGLKERSSIMVDNVSPLSPQIESPKEISFNSFLDNTPSANTRDIQIEALEERNSASVVDVSSTISKTASVAPESSSQSKLISLVDVLPSSETKQIDTARSKEVQHIFATDSAENSRSENGQETTNPTASELNPVPSENAQQPTNLLDLSDAYKLAVGDRGRRLSDALAEQWLAKDVSRISEDLKQLLSQLSAARDAPMSPRVPISPRVSVSPRISMSPKLSLNSDEWRTNDASMQILQKRVSFERSESNLSLEGSIVYEIEGESEVDRLKRQIEHDRKLLAALYKELEEERNASAIAASQAMAMITRLQEEKASLHMEAFQCLRMMEEQAEFDMEAVQKTNELLTDREKEIQDLEAELEYYKEKYGDEYFAESGVEPLPESSQVDTNQSGAIDLLEFETEGSFISQALKRLEKKIHLFANHGLPVDDLNSKLGSDLRGRAEDQDVPTSKTEASETYEHVISLDKPDYSGKESHEIFYSVDSSPHVSRNQELDAMAEELSDLKERLNALEADKAFLEHAVNALKQEDKLKLVHEIASQLKEQRRVNMRRKQQNVD